MKIIYRLTLIILLTVFTACGEILDDVDTRTSYQGDELIYLVGGLSSTSIGSVVAQIDMFDPAAGEWYPAITSIPVPVSFAGIAGYNGKIYIIGGFNSAGDVTNTVQIYDTVTGLWSTGTAMTENRANHSATALNGIIYITRGTTGNAGVAWTVGTLTNTLIYNIANDSWSSGVADLAYSNKSVVQFDNVIYYTGGKSATSVLQTAHDGIVISNNTTTNTVTEVLLTAARVGHASTIATVNSVSYHLVIGGFSAITNTGCYVFNNATASNLVSFFHYLRYPFANTTSNTWVPMTEITFATGFASLALAENMIFYFGGAQSHNSGGSRKVYSYDLSLFPGGSWAEEIDMPVARFGHVAVKL